MLSQYIKIKSHLMNFIGIDPSLISTAVVVNGNITNYCRESAVYTKSGMSKWFKSAEQYCHYKFVNYRDFDNYSDGELIKLKDYDLVTEMIVDDILSKINVEEETHIGIEGYNFGAQVGDLIDLVAFSTLLRKKLYDRVSNNITVFSPTTLKLEACKFTYPPIVKEVGKKVKRIEYEYRNPLGIPGGKFIKTDMARAIIDNNSVSDDKWFTYLKTVQTEVLTMKNIPKPHEDVNDAWLLYHILKKQHSKVDI
jgi:hypothetical protein